MIIAALAIFESEGDERFFLRHADSWLSNLIGQGTIIYQGAEFGPHSAAFLSVGCLSNQAVFGIALDVGSWP